ncbi:MAG: hypothetical protein ACMG6E_08325 [Candidatus Roizmanbacteria bacterium]
MFVEQVIVEGEEAVLFLIDFGLFLAFGLFYMSTFEEFLGMSAKLLC